MSQLSFFSAESVPPAVADLTGMLAAPGQVVLVGSRTDQAARLSVVVDRLWRAEALAEMIADAGLQPEIARTDENTPLVRTAVDPRLVAIARDWTRGRRQDRASAVAARARANYGPGRWRPAPRKPTGTCSAWTRTPPTRIRRSPRP